MTVTYKDIRAWGIANGHKCRTGKLGQGVVAAYAAAHPDAVIVDLPEPVEPSPVEPSPVEPETEGEAFTVTVVISGHDETAADISQQLVNAIYAAFEAGRAAERAAILTQLGVDA